MILDNFQKKLAEFLKAKDTKRLGVLRYFLAQAKNKQIELRPGGQPLTDEILFRVLKKQIKQVNEAKELYEKAGRSEDVARMSGELEILNEFVQEFPPEVVQAATH